MSFGHDILGRAATDRRRWSGRSPTRRHAVAAAAVLVAVLVAAGRAEAQPAFFGEYEVKAAFLYNFARFVEWPGDAFATEEAPFVLCVVGEDPFGTILDDTVRDGSIHDRRVELRRTVWDVGGCHLLYVSHSERDRLPDLVASLATRSVLTVGEAGAFEEAGGMIAFQLEENRVRFSINLGTANRARLRISSRLLDLASTVRTDPARDGDDGD